MSIRSEVGMRRVERSTGVSSGEDPVVKDLDGLLKAVGIPDTEALVDEMENRTDGMTWIDVTSFRETELIVGLERMALGPNYPFTIAEFWDLLHECDSESHAMIEADGAWSDLADEIETVEGFVVEVTNFPSGPG